jgi:cytochrome b561
MQIRNSERAWGAVQQGLHWFIVVAVIAQLTIGLIFANLPENDPRAGTLFGVHATLGLVIFLGMLTRFVWRQANPVPALPDTLKPYEKRIALANHWAFYALIIGMPISGYLMVNAHGFAVPFSGIELPRLLDKNKAWGDALESLHIGGAFTLMGLILLHVAAALRHEFLLKDNTLRRMTPLPERDTEPFGRKPVADRPATRSGYGGESTN